MIASVRTFSFVACVGFAICAVPAAAAPGDFSITVSGSQDVYDGGGHAVSGAATDFSSLAPLTVTQARRFGNGAPFAFGAGDPAASIDNRATESDGTHAPHDGLSVHGFLDAHAGGGPGGSESGYDFSVTVHN